MRGQTQVRPAANRARNVASPNVMQLSNAVRTLTDFRFFAGAVPDISIFIPTSLRPLSESFSRNPTPKYVSIFPFVEGGMSWFPWSAPHPVLHLT